MPPTTMLCVSALGGYDVHVVAAPDIECALLKQEGEADGKQHLAQNVGLDRDNRDAGENEKESQSDNRRDKDEWTPSIADKMTAHGGECGDDAETDRDRGVADAFEPLRTQKQTLHHEAERCDSERRDRQRQCPRSRRVNDRQGDVSAEEEIRAMRQVDDAHDAEDQR